LQDVDADAKLSDGVREWGFRVPNSLEIGCSSKVNEKGRGFETGELSRDGKELATGHLQLLLGSFHQVLRGEAEFLQQNLQRTDAPNVVMPMTAPCVPT
jgi:hypothetical protein